MKQHYNDRTEKKGRNAFFSCLIDWLHTFNRGEGGGGGNICINNKQVLDNTEPEWLHHMAFVPKMSFDQIQNKNMKVLLFSVLL